MTTSKRPDPRDSSATDAMRRLQDIERTTEAAREALCNTEMPGAERKLLVAASLDRVLQLVGHAKSNMVDHLQLLEEALDESARRAREADERLHALTGSTSHAVWADYIEALCYQLLDSQPAQDREETA